MKATKTQVIILLGPPGAGKGSQAALIKERLKLAHLSTGDLLRENIRQGTPLGEKAKAYMDEGKLVPDDLIFEILFARSRQPDCQNGYLLDGFPRNLDQAKELQNQLDDHEVIAVNLSLPDSVIIERITKRQVCKTCQTPYHLIYAPPKFPGICDKCGGSLYHRSDDTKDIVDNRLKVYREKTAPLVDYYRKQNILHEIDSTKSKEAILLQILNLLSRR